MCPCTLALEHTVLRRPSAESSDDFLFCCVKGLGMSSFYHFGRASQSLEQTLGTRKPTMKSKEQPLYSHLHQLNTIYNTIKTDRYN